VFKRLTSTLMGSAMLCVCGALITTAALADARSDTHDRPGVAVPRQTESPATSFEVSVRVLPPSTPAPTRLPSPADRTPGLSPAVPDAGTEKTRESHDSRNSEWIDEVIASIIGVAEHDRSTGRGHHQNDHRDTHGGKSDDSTESAAIPGRPVTPEESTETGRLPFTGMNSQRLGILISAGSLTLLTGGILIRMAARRRRRTPGKYSRRAETPGR
jgi:hypothetical protein